MEDLITIPSRYIKYLIPAWKDRVSEIDASLKALQAEKGDLLANIEKHSSKVLESDIPKQQGLFGDREDDFKNATTWWSKAIYFLSRSDKPLATAEIVDRMVEKDGTIDRATAISAVSSVLGVKATAGKLRRIKKEGEDQKFVLIK